MREILFHGKAINDGEWHVGGYYMDDSYGGCPEGKHYIMVWNSTGLGCYQALQVERESVGQSTGLRDKNQKLIFEGDILQYGDYQYEVYWSEDWAMYAVKGAYNQALMRIAFESEIVGRRFDQAKGQSA